MYQPTQLNKTLLVRNSISRTSWRGMRLIGLAFVYIVLAPTVQAVNPPPDGGNTAVGCNALHDNTTGNTNTATGSQALANNDSGSSNTANGSASAQCPPAMDGSFVMRVLSGGASNELRVPIQDASVPTRLRVTTKWLPNTAWYGEAGCSEANESPQSVSLTRRVAVEGRTETIISFLVDRPPCKWPPIQKAEMTIADARLTEGGNAPHLFDGTVRVSVLWFPLLVALSSVAIIYPGCAWISWYTRLRRYRKAEPPPAEIPTFWKSLDPVQLTANSYGRASLSKLQIFVFTLMIFGILIFFQFRNRYLANLSTDIMLLLGISAVGAAGGKLTYIAKRRLGLDNWSWLRRKGWLPEKGDVAQRTKWADLFTDSDTKEFDVYSFQMAVFSVVVAVALISTNASGLEAFQIPPQLLALLGLSQVIYVGGKGIEKTGYPELDAKLTEVRQHEVKYRVAKATNNNQDAEKERQEYKARVAEAADMFWALYESQLPDKPLVLSNVNTVEPQGAV